MEKVELIIIGGGPAGLAAAIKAREEGVRDVLVLERNEELGGILPQCIHTGFGLHYFGENLTGPEYISRFIRKIEELGIACKLNTMVLAITPGKKVLAANSVDGFMELQAKAIVLAMGCREQTRGALGIPGTRPAGVFTAGTVQRLMDLEGYMPGNRVVVLGSGDVGLIVARRLAMEGAKVEAVVEALPYPGGSDRNVVQCLEDFNIPLLLKHTITLIHGNERVEGVTVAEVNERGKPLPNTEKKIGCDTLVISAGLIPENELSKGAGIALDPATKGPIIDERAETLVPGMFACGNVVHVHDLVDHVSRGGELAGTGAASYIAGKLLPARKRMRLLPGDNTRYVVPQVISGELPVDLHLRASRPMRGVAVKIGGLSFPRRAVKPSELIVIPLTPTELRRAGIRDGLRVSIEAEG